MHWGISLGLFESRTFLRDKVKESFSRNDKTLCSGVFRTCHRNRMVRLIFRVVLVSTVRIGTSTVRNRDKMNIFPRSTIVRAVASVCTYCPDGFLPDIKI